MIFALDLWCRVGFRGARLVSAYVLPPQDVRPTRLRADRREQARGRRRPPEGDRQSRSRRRTGRLRRARLAHRLGRQTHRPGAAHRRARRGRRRGAIGGGKADRRPDAVRPDLGAAGDRRGPRRSAQGSRVRVSGRARRVRRRAAPPVRLGFGSRRLGVDGGLRHPRGRRARPASLLPRHGLARRGGRGEARRSARAALRQGPDRGKAVRPPPRSLHRPLGGVHGTPPACRSTARAARRSASAAIPRTIAPI